MHEVETVCRTLAEAVVDQRVEAVRIARNDVVRGPQTLLRGQRIVRVLRHGKQLALVGDRGGCVCVHLGMSGSLRVVRSNETSSDELDSSPTDHVLVTWTFAHGTELRFRDPRRFGGVWAFTDEAELRERRWDKLGPDGLVVTPGRLHAGLSRTHC